MPIATQAQANQNVVNGGSTTPVVFSTLGCKYTWTNTDPSIGLAVAGTGDIVSFKAINNGTAPVTATITGTTSLLSPSIYSIGVNGLDVLDPVTLQPTNNIDKNLSGYFLFASPDGNTLYFQAFTPFRIIGISAITNKVTVTIPGTGTDQSSTISPDGSKMYVDNSEPNNITTNTITVFNTSTGAVESIIDVGTHVGRKTLSPDGNRLYVLLYLENNVAVYNTATNALISKLSVPFRSTSAMLVTPDGNYLVLSDQMTICITDTRSGTSTSVTIPNLLLPRFFVSPDSKQLYVTCTDKHADKAYLYAVDIPSGAVTSIPTDLKIFSFLLTQDGKQIYLSDTETGKITVIDAATKAIKTDIKIDPDIPQVLFENGYRVSYASLNYDGSLMYVSTATQSKSGIITSTTTEIDTKTNTIIKKDIPVASGGLISPPPPTGCSGAPIRFNITVYPDAPIINASGTLRAMSTTYGIPSTSASFTVSGSKINIGILVTPPPGFEVSIDNTSFADSVNVGPSPTVPSTQVYVRLKSSATVGTHSGDIIVSNGPTSVSIATAASEVTGVQLTISANNVTKTYGAVLNTALASTAFTASGLKNGEKIGSVIMNYGAGAAATDVVNTYTGSVTPSSATGGTFLAGNYTITYQKGNINIAPAPLKITVDDQTRGFNDANPPFAVKYSGFVNNETATILTSQPVLATTANLTSPIGQYPITASGASAVNYAISYVAGTLNIIAKPVIVTNAFTPNNDGINDTWDIKNINEYPGCTVEIFNRYGQKMYYSNGYAIPWEGKRNGANLPTGTYYYIIKLDTGIKPLTGYLAIIR